MTDFFIPGHPIAKGSWRPIVHKRTKRIVFLPNNEQKYGSWVGTIKTYAVNTGLSPTHNPITLILDFTFNRPKSHYRTGKNSHLLKANAPDFPINPPDIDKLARMLLDALTGIAYFDDSQVIHLSCRKTWTAPEQLEGVHVSVIQR